MTAQVLFAGLAPGSAGLYQVNVVVPSLSAGNYPVLFGYQGAQTQTGVTIAVQP